MLQCIRDRDGRVWSKLWLLICTETLIVLNRATCSICPSVTALFGRARY